MAAVSPVDVLMEFLVNSLNFSIKLANSTTDKLNHSRYTHYDPHLLLHLLDEISMNKSEIKTLVSTSPQLLFCRVDENLKPKIKISKQHGLSGFQLATFRTRSNFFKTGLHIVLLSLILFI